MLTFHLCVYFIQATGCISCVHVGVNGQSPIITSLPESLFGASGGVHSVVEGSVIQLYCSVEPVNATVSWTKDNVPVIIDVPHLRVRMSSNGTHNTSVLTLDNFRSEDNGMYQCCAMSGGVTESGSTVSLNGKINVHAIEQKVQHNTKDFFTPFSQLLVRQSLVH